MYSPTLATVPFSSAVPTSAFIRSGRLNLIQRMPLSSGSYSRYSTSFGPMVVLPADYANDSVIAE